MTTNQKQAISGYPGYFIEPQGTVTHETDKETVYVPVVFRTKHGTAYPYVRLQNAAGKRVECSLLTLMAETFLGPCPHGSVLSRKNGISVDYRAENLCYITPAERLLRTASVSRSRKVVCLRSDGTYLQTFSSLRACAKQCGIALSSLRRFCVFACGLGIAPDGNIYLFSDDANRRLRIQRCLKSCSRTA